MSELDVRDTEWMNRARCKGMPGNLFFPKQGERPVAALEACAACPVRTQCLQYAVDHKIRDGIWGGMIGAERKQIFRI